MNGKWSPASQAPEGVVVMTRSGRLWFVPDGSTYVYYTPTHFWEWLP